jgi:hypothetical protein
MWKNYFSQLLNVHRVRDVRQREIHRAETLVPDPRPFQVEIAIANLKRFKSPGSDQIPTEPNKAGGEILRCEIHKLINSVWSKEVEGVPFGFHKMLGNASVAAQLAASLEGLLSLLVRLSLSSWNFFNG